MKIKTGALDHVGPPKDYAELYRLYYSYVCSLVRKYGIDDQRKEDVASEILLKFYERDFLTKFDPTLTFEYKGQMRPAKFQTFLTMFVITYVQGHRDRQKREREREAFINDMTVGKFYGETWIEVFGGQCPDHSDDVDELVDYTALTDRVRRYLAEVPRRSKFDLCDLVALFNEVDRQIAIYGYWSIPELRKVFGVSSTAMHGWLNRLREHIAIALDRPAPPKKTIARKAAKS